MRQQAEREVVNEEEEVDEKNNSCKENVYNKINDFFHGEKYMFLVFALGCHDGTDNTVYKMREIYQMGDEATATTQRRSTEKKNENKYSHRRA